MTVGIDPRHTEGPLYSTCRRFPRPSPPFALFVPALLFAAARAPARRRRAGPAVRERRAAGLFAVVGIGWLLLFSLSRSKFLHYAYPVFPVLALSLAAGFAALVRGLEAKLAATSGTRNANGVPAVRPVAAAAWVALLFLLAIVCCRFGFSLMRGRARSTCRGKSTARSSPPSPTAPPGWSSAAFPPRQPNGARKGPSSPPT